MHAYTLIETADIEIIGVRIYLDRGKASGDFNKILKEHGLHEIPQEELGEEELQGTIRMAGDDAHCVQLIERLVEPGIGHDFVVTVSGCDREQALQVMAERLACDEDYGFEYQIDWKRT